MCNSYCRECVCTRKSESYVSPLDIARENYQKKREHEQFMQGHKREEAERQREERRSAAERLGNRWW